MLPLTIDWFPVTAVVGIGALLLLLLRLTVWLAARRARAHTTALIRQLQADSTAEHASDGLGRS